jgi:hypothetical protein
MEARGAADRGGGAGKQLNRWNWVPPGLVAEANGLLMLSKR